MIKGHDIVCLSFGTWDDDWGTPQQLMSRLAKHNRVFFVDQPISLLSFFMGVRTKDEVWRDLKRWRRGYREVAKNVYAGSPPPNLPSRSNKIVNVISGFILRRWLARQVRQIGFKDPIYWNFQPWFPNLGRAMQPALSVYHCVDDWASVPHWWISASSVRARDAECCREADVVICTGRNLAQSRRHLNPNVHFLPNGASVELFASATLPETRVPDDIARLPGKIIGFVGVMDFRMDFGLVAYMAKRQPDWSFALVGPVKSDAEGIAQLSELPNVHLLGNRTITRLPAYIKAMDVCLIPYVISEHTHHLFPLKLFEYMAAGKPIVATDMAEMRPYAGNEMTLARSKEEFHEAVVQAIANDSPERVAARLRIAGENSWDHRVQQVTEILDPLLRERGWKAQGARVKSLATAPESRGAGVVRERP
jgi:glycosyltransferase involved in cell wall biosynthesis